mmetsp:Transcript_42537/g.102509  ORF Transcript_42537/g.102509 Transcript_42537/m.102509 type:complete len:516 (+) Transcript_42537:2110-3657(+)
MVKSLKKKKTVVTKPTLKTAHKKNVSKKPAIKKTNAKENSTSTVKTTPSNLSHISLLSPIATTDRKNKTDVADTATGVATANTSWKMRDIVNPTKNDVLMGRGGKNNQWTGNEKLREIARTRAAEYAVASKRAKSQISRELVEDIRLLSPPGRFLKKCPNSKWEDVGDEIAREKTSQVLRDAIQAKKSFSGDTPTRIRSDRKRAPQPPSRPATNNPRVQHDQPIDRITAIRQAQRSSMETITARSPPMSYRQTTQDQREYVSSQSSSSQYRALWIQPRDQPRYHHPASTNSMDSGLPMWRRQQQHYSYSSSYPYGYQPSFQYPVAAAASSTASAAPRKRPRYDEMPPPVYGYSPQQRYYQSIHNAPTPPISDMFSPPNARMQAFSPASTAASLPAPVPSLSSSYSYSDHGGSGMEVDHSAVSSPGKPKMVASQASQIAGRDCWISDVPRFSSLATTVAKAANTKNERPQRSDHRPSPPQADLGLYQEDLLSEDSDHDRKDGSLSPPFAHRRDHMM